MDTDKVLDELRTFARLLDANHAAYQHGDETAHPTYAELQAREPIVKRIFEAIDPNLFGIIRSRARSSLEWRWRPWIEATRKAIALVERREELEEMLGDAGPRLAVDRLHPVVWNAARLLYRDGHYREAVRTAAEAFNGHVRAELGITGLSGSTLIEQAYSASDPTEDRPRLRPPHDLDDETRKSLRDGARNYGVGIMKMVRNWSTHVREELPEQVAAEMLAALSVFARRIEADHLENVEGCQAEPHVV